MRSSKLARLSALLLISSGPLLLSCTHNPPDVLGCTGYLAEDWPEMRETFFKLCYDTPSCRARLDWWKETIANWSYPTDSGTCITWMSRKTYDIDKKHPAPIKNDKGKPKTWPEIAETGIFLPAKESVAPLKTFVQSFCHDNRECGQAGNWESTIKETDETITLQKEKAESARK